MRLRITIDITRTRKPAPVPVPDTTEYAPQVDVKHAASLELSGQPQADDMRADRVPEHWYRAGFLPNGEQR